MTLRSRLNCTPQFRQRGTSRGAKCGVSSTSGSNSASRYLLPRRWPRYVLLASIVIFSILTTLLIDARLYWTAGVTGLLAAVGLIALGIELILAWRGKAERERLQAERADRRAAAAQVRAEKFEAVRASTAEVAMGLTGSAAGLANAAKSRVASFADLTKNSAAGLADVTKNTAAGLADVTKSSAAGLANVTKGSAAGLADLTKNNAAGLADVTKNSAVGLADATKRGFTGARGRLSAWRNKPNAE